MGATNRNHKSRLMKAMILKRWLKRRCRNMARLQLFNRHLVAKLEPLVELPVRRQLILLSVKTMLKIKLTSRLRKTRLIRQTARRSSCWWEERSMIPGQPLRRARRIVSKIRQSRPKMLAPRKNQPKKVKHLHWMCPQIKFLAILESTNCRQLTKKAKRAIMVSRVHNNTSHQNHFYDARLKPF